MRSRHGPIIRAASSDKLGAFDHTTGDAVETGLDLVPDHFRLFQSGARLPPNSEQAALTAHTGSY
jgi:hypothetical protein